MRIMCLAAKGGTRRCVLPCTCLSLLLGPGLEGAALLSVKWLLRSSWK
jgi:hypothetical protein